MVRGVMKGCRDNQPLLACFLIWLPPSLLVLSLNYVVLDKDIVMYVIQAVLLTNSSSQYSV